MGYLMFNLEVIFFTVSEVLWGVTVIPGKVGQADKNLPS